MKQPPVLAKWLLSRFAPTITDSFVGDLQEEYTRGRSEWWYWKQVANGIGTATLRYVRRHPLIAARGLVGVWCCLFVFIHFLPAVSGLDRELFERGVVDIRLWWPDSAVYIVALSVGCAMSGWIVSRFHSPVLLLPYVMTLVVWHTWAFPRLLYVYISDPTNTPFFELILIYYALMPVSILAGGLFTNFAASRGHHSRPDPQVS